MYLVTLSTVPGICHEQLHNLSDLHSSFQPSPNEPDAIKIISCTKQSSKQSNLEEEPKIKAKNDNYIHR